MTYDEMKKNPEEYHWGYSLYTHYEDGGLHNVSSMDTVSKIVMVLNGGVTDHFNDISKVHNGTLAYIIYQISIFILFDTFLLTFCCIRVGRKWLHNKNNKLCCQNSTMIQQFRARRRY